MRPDGGQLHGLARLLAAGQLEISVASSYALRDAADALAVVGGRAGGLSRSRIKSDTTARSSTARHPNQRVWSAGAQPSPMAAAPMTARGYRGIARRHLRGDARPYGCRSGSRNELIARAAPGMSPTPRRLPIVKRKVRPCLPRPR
jgi:hypothetical protein